MHLTQIWVYPVKSLPGVRLEKAEIDSRGFFMDRHWMLVDGQGRFLSQRRLPTMALIRVSLQNQTVILNADLQPALSLKYGQHEGRLLTVNIWDEDLPAYQVSDKADQWFSTVLGENVHLVCMSEKVTRKVDPDYAGDSDVTGFSDGFPFLLIGESSVADLNSRIGDPAMTMDIKRFRPNLVVRGSLPYAEDSWKKIRIGDIEFRVVKPCSRCVITTVDPETAIKGVEPLKTLNTYRRNGNKVFFGQNLIHDATGVLGEGDAVVVIE